MSHRNADPITRYLVVTDKRIVASARSREESRALASREKAFPCPAGQSIRIRKFLLYPNPAIVAFGVDRFDAMLTGICDNGITLMGTLDNLIECGAIGSYIRTVLGKSGSKSSCDEFGNRYSLLKRGKERYELSLYFSNEPEEPHRNAIRAVGVPKSPEETDISNVLASIAGCRRSSAS